MTHLLHQERHYGFSRQEAAATAPRVRRRWRPAIDLGLGFVRATRITYVGELGWELVVPYDIAVHVWDTLREAGQPYGLRPAGYCSLNSPRMEKGYRSWGHDISAGDTPLEAGLGFTVAWDKPAGFRGRAALLRQKEMGVDRRLVQLALEDPEPLLLHDEPIYRDGVLVGRVASAAYGHTLGRSVALGSVSAPEPELPRSWYESGHYEIELACERHVARVSLQPLYDPKSEGPKSRTGSCDPAGSAHMVESLTHLLHQRLHHGETAPTRHER